MCDRCFIPTHGQLYAVLAGFLLPFLELITAEDRSLTTKQFLCRFVDGGPVDWM